RPGEARRARFRSDRRHVRRVCRTAGERDGQVGEGHQGGGRQARVMRAAAVALASFSPDTFARGDMSSRITAWLWLVALMMAAASTAYGQTPSAGSYPNKTIRIVTSEPGGV